MDPAIRADSARRSVRVSKTAELIADDLRARIARGELKDGDVLPAELELVRQFGVSRPTLREAFRILENESLIIVRRGSRGGVVVTSPDLSVVARSLGLALQMSRVTMADLYEVCILLESSAVGLLAKRRRPADVRDLKASCAALAVLVSGGEEVHNVNRQTEVSLQFHDLIAERSGNTTLAILLQVLREVVSRHLSLVMTSVDRRELDRQFKKMVSICAQTTTLIESGDAVKAESFWKRELTQAGKGMLWARVPGDSRLELFVDAPVLRQLSAT
jgi:GntR family transcriptional regulator, transcriptional repressor for pyruvate dehydrogenase complex